MSAEWYYHDGTKVHGPISPRQLAELAARGSLRPGHRVRKGADGKWHLASQVKGLSFAPALQTEAVIVVAKASPPPLPACQELTAHPVAANRDLAAGASDRGTTATKPTLIARSTDSGFLGHLPLYLQRLVRSRMPSYHAFVARLPPYLQRFMRPPLGSSLVTAACGLAVIVVAAVGFTLGRPTRPQPGRAIAQADNNDKASQDPNYAEAYCSRVSHSQIGRPGMMPLRITPRPSASSPLLPKPSAAGVTLSSKGVGGKGYRIARQQPRIKDCDQHNWQGRTCVWMRPWLTSLKQSGLTRSMPRRMQTVAKCTLAGASIARPLPTALRPFSSTPTGPPAYYWRGLACMRKNDLDTAVTDFTKAVQLNPVHSEAYFNRAVAFASKGDFDRCIADSTEAVRLNPKYGDANLIRGIAYGEKGEQGKAISDYSEAIRLNSSSAIAYACRGEAYKKTGETARANADFAEAKRRGFVQAPAQVAAEQPTPSIQPIPSRDSAKAYCDLGDAGTVRRVVGRAVAVLPVQLVVDRLLGQPEDLADAVVEPLGIVDQGGVQFDFQIHAGAAATIVVVGDLAADADVRFQGHCALLIV